MIVKLKTTRTVIQGVPEAWRRQYSERKDLPWVEGIQNQLDALDLKTVTAKDIAAIVGNESWTALACDACNAPKKRLVSISNDDVYPPLQLADLCASCLEAASAVLFSRKAAK